MIMTNSQTVVSKALPDEKNYFKSIIFLSLKLMEIIFVCT